MAKPDTDQQFKDVMAECRELFAKKLHEMCIRDRLSTRSANSPWAFLLNFSHRMNVIVVHSLLFWHQVPCDDWHNIEYVTLQSVIASSLHRSYAVCAICICTQVSATIIWRVGIYSTASRPRSRLWTAVSTKAKWHEQSWHWERRPHFVRCLVPTWSVSIPIPPLASLDLVLPDCFVRHTLCQVGWVSHAAYAWSWNCPAAISSIASTL